VTFALKPNQPNPFAGKTSIGFDLPVGCDVSLKVFDAQGRQVKLLAHRGYPAGRHSVVWVGDGDGGERVGSGIYFVRIEAGDFRAVSKVLVAR
jgi:flagellar hook assembly protein FlgD